jgi:signal transduction histidine kinase
VIRALPLSYTRLTTTTRAFALLVVAVPVLWARDTAALPYLVLLATIWTAASWLDHRDLPRWAARVDLVEAALVGATCGLALQESMGLSAALAVPPFISGLRHGFRAAATALAAELVVLVGLTLLLSDGMPSQQGVSTVTWAVTGLGLGLVAGFFASAAEEEPDALAPYRDARALILELLDLSGSLSSGLDPVVLGNDILEMVQDRVPAAALTVHVKRDDELTPLTRLDVDTWSDTTKADALAMDVLNDPVPHISGRSFAFPITTDAGIVGVVTGVLSDDAQPDRFGLLALLEGYVDQVVPTAIRLDTALLFGRFRDTATADERRRLAREMHDGVAQDIASMGYLVDALAAAPSSPDQARQLTLLREAISSVVAEVRRSVLTLRSSTDGADSLGAAISGLARHLSAVSGVPIQVTLDEQTTRLRPEIEAELLRIVQESLNNAVKHAQASLIDVQCRVNPPEVSIVVADNGRGLQGRRVDSHGLEIMNERARLIGAELEVTNRASGGAQVSVRIASGTGPSSPTVERGQEVLAT